jgi:hypothetical protein
LGGCGPANRRGCPCHISRHHAHKPQSACAWTRSWLCRDARTAREMGKTPRDTDGAQSAGDGGVCLVGGGAPMTRTAEAYVGSCHCGAIGFAYRTDQHASTWRVRACQCGFCRAHQALSTSDPAGSIEFEERHAGLLNRYHFGQHTADFLICRQCGVYIGALIETARGGFGIINVNALRPIPSGLSEPAMMEYGSESKEQRIARREQRWSPVTALRLQP